MRTEEVRAQLNAPLILWSQDPAKGKQVSGEKMARSVISSIRDGDIILLHDSTEANLDAACRIIDALQPKGYDFVTVDELFRLRGVTPQNGQIYKSVPPQTDPQAYNEGRLKEHWAYSSICTMEETGIMTGDSGGWHPNRYLTRRARLVPGCFPAGLVRPGCGLGGGGRRCEGNRAGPILPGGAGEPPAVLCDAGPAAPGTEDRLVHGFRPGL